jgi:predicted cobalt transporter CbtA
VNGLNPLTAAASAADRQGIWLATVASIARMKYIPLLFCLVGGGLLVFSVVSYCGHALPYQDPTPELLAVQRHQLFTAKIGVIIGFGFIVIGGVLGFIPKRAS